MRKYLSNTMAVIAAASLPYLGGGAWAASGDEAPDQNQKACFSGTVQQALAGCSALIQGGASGKTLALAYARRGHARIEAENDHARAIEDFKAALAIQPGDTHTRLGLADALLSDAIKQPVIDRRNLGTIRTQLRESASNVEEARRGGLGNPADETDARATLDIVASWMDFLELFDTEIPAFRAKSFAGKQITFGGRGGRTTAVVLWSSLYEEADRKEEFAGMRSFVKRHPGQAVQLVAVEMDDAVYGRKLAKQLPFASIYQSDAGDSARALFQKMQKELGVGAGFIVSDQGQLLAVLRHRDDFWKRLDEALSETTPRKAQ